MSDIGWEDINGARIIGKGYYLFDDPTSFCDNEAAYFTVLLNDGRQAKIECTSDETVIVTFD